MSFSFSFLFGLTAIACLSLYFAMLLFPFSLKSLIEKKLCMCILSFPVLVLFVFCFVSFFLHIQTLFENIHSIVRNNIIFHGEAAGIAMYAAKASVVLHNTIWAASQSAQTPILINGMQHYWNWSYSPIQTCEGPGRSCSECLVCLTVFLCVLHAVVLVFVCFLGVLFGHSISDSPMNQKNNESVFVLFCLFCLSRSCHRS